VKSELLNGVVAMFLFAATQMLPLQAQVTGGQTVDASTNSEDMTDAIQVRHWVDRTALFAGDTVNYYLEISCARDVDILLEDLDASQLQLDGLELVGSAQTSTEEDGRVTYHVRYSLTNYDVNTPVMQIGAQTIRYFTRRTAVSADSATPAGEVVIPPTALSLRSTLASEPMQSRLRDGLSSVIIPGYPGWIRTAGFLLLLVSAAPVASSVVTLLRKRSGEMRQRQVVQATVEAEQGVLEQLRKISPASESERRQGYDQLDQIVRDLLVQTMGASANALTAAEIASQLSDRRLPVAVDQLAAVVADCEQARYGRPGQLPDAGRFEAGVDLVRRLLIVH